jgi:hypothetical protein
VQRASLFNWPFSVWPTIRSQARCATDWPVKAVVKIASSQQLQSVLVTPAQQPSWWATAHIHTGTDIINESIWKNSLQIHTRHGFTPGALSQQGSIGAQQAMLDPIITHGISNPPPVLPWVPDLLGTDWTHEDGIIIVGQNYGQFITGYTTRPKRMSAQTYANAITWQAFQRAFINNVVIDDQDFYEPLAPLLNTTGTKARFVVTDLVKNTLVERGPTTPRAATRIDRNIDIKDGHHCAVYGAYADLLESKDWLWDRLVSTKARTIIGLGRAPYCGLLRLFATKSCTITDHRTGKPWRFRGERWMYDCGISGIGGRIANHDWHDANSATLQRSWHVILVAHPTRENSNYQQAIPVISAARQKTRHNNTPTPIIS